MPIEVLSRCPKCGSLISFRFPLHDCKLKPKKPKPKPPKYEGLMSALKEVEAMTRRTKK